jgi:alkanesulfonate monooxygenase SsuD/methylene tetrahydromethanopterin reductase-like flavin-dependent oxidoreductase (luciferase family)
VHEDRERAWNDVAPYLIYQQNFYRRWYTAAGDRPVDGAQYPQVRDVKELQNPDFLIGDPDEVVAKIKDFYDAVAFTDFSFWLLLPGMPFELAERALGLFAERVLPELRMLGAEESSVAVAASQEDV